MYTPILTGVIAVLFLLFYRRSKYYQARPDSYGMKIFLTAVVWFVGNLVALIVLLEVIPTKTVVHERQLASMRTASAVNGSFFLGSGVVGSQVSYHFYIKNSDGSVTPHQIAASPMVRILEDASLKDSGALQEIYTEFDYSSPLADWMVRHKKRKALLQQVLRVPVGTVVQTFAAQ